MSEISETKGYYYILFICFIVGIICSILAMITDQKTPEYVYRYTDTQDKQGVAKECHAEEEIYCVTDNDMVIRVNNFYKIENKEEK